MEKAFIVIASFSVLVVISFMIHLSWKFIISKIRLCYYTVLIFIKNKIYRFNIIKLIWKVMKSNCYNYNDIILSLFIHFYDKNFKDIEKWEFDEISFPEGKKELTDFYRWVSCIRKENYCEFNKLFYSNDKINYWNGTYESFDFKIDYDGRLKILPIEYSSVEDRSLAFFKKRLKLQNALYDLDTQKSLWVLERRKHFEM